MDIAQLPASLVLACLAWPAAAAAPVEDARLVGTDIRGAVALPGTGTLLLWGSGATILRSADGVNWSHAETPGDADLARIASNTDGSVLIAVGAHGAVMRSTDGGQSWHAARNTGDADLETVSFHAPSSAWVAAGAHGRILRSTDRGKHWKPLPSTFSSGLLTSFVDAKTQRLLIGGEGGVVGVSADGGTSWDVTRISMPGPVTPVTGFHRFGDRLLATSARGRFLLSTDDGDSWELLQAEGTASWTDAALGDEHGALVLVGDNGDVLRSTNHGQDWELDAIDLDGRRHSLAAVHFDAACRSLLAVGQGGTLARSIDGGRHWERAWNAVPENYRGLVAAGELRVAFGDAGLVVTSTDAGLHWSRARFSPRSAR
jgi:photosystem II stability/assembly factor-like uncharacterized protein